MTTQFRRVLPLYFGIVDTPLMVWDIHNQRVILSVGMGWDMGAPSWPYQTPDTLLLALNLPAYLIARPLERLLHLYAPLHYFVLFPAFLLWWLLVGHALDCDLWRSDRLRWHWWAISVLLAVAFAVTGAIDLHDAIAWWNKYCGQVFMSQNIITLRACAPGLWCLAVAAAAAVLAKRRWPLK